MSKIGKREEGSKGAREEGRKGARGKGGREQGGRGKGRKGAEEGRRGRKRAEGGGKGIGHRGARADGRANESNEAPGMKDVSSFEIHTMNAARKLLFLTLYLSVLSCADTGPGNMAGCCEKEALSAAIGNGHLFVPNFFTPNADGTDDYLYPRGENISKIIVLEIRDFRDDIVFHIENAAPDDPLYGWNGDVDGELLQGLYSFQITAEAEDGSTGTYSGEVCNYPCGVVSNLEIENPFGCYSGILWDCQQNSNGCHKIELTNCQ